MEIGQLALKAKRAAAGAAAALGRYRRFETVIAGVCISIPLVLILGDHGNVRDSISAYYSMDHSQLFYFPLSVAAMLFVVNGVLRKKHYYNWLLGALLSGVVLFNHVDESLLHLIFAATFFGGNALVILFHSSKKTLAFRISMVSIIIAAMLGCFAFKWYSLFWAEWMSFSIIAFHYLLEIHCEHAGVKIQGHRKLVRKRPGCAMPGPSKSDHLNLTIIPSYRNDCRRPGKAQCSLRTHLSAPHQLNLPELRNLREVVIRTTLESLVFLSV